MTSSYLFWAAVAVVGAIAGAFLKPRTLGMLGGALFALCIIGLLVSAALHNETLTWVFGIGGMIVPLVAGVAFVAGAIVHVLLRTFKRKKFPPD